MKASTPLISLKNLYKTYYLGEEAVPALANINLTINTQEYVSIVGSSGCGKSTLMHIIGLLETPSKGQVILSGRSTAKLGDQSLSQARNRTIGFVFQSFNLINKYTVLENVMLPARYAKTKLDFDPQSKALKLLERFGIAHRANFFPNKISGGEQQRVAIARALVMDPALILADEPTGNLDTQNGRQILKLLEDLNRQLKVTVIIVTHEPSIAKRARRRIKMKDGRIIN